MDIKLSIKIFLLSPLTITVFGQSNVVRIKGNVYTVPFYRTTDTVSVKNARVKLVCKDTTYFYLTSEDGSFNFQVNQATETATLAVETSKSTVSKAKYLCIFTSPSISQGFRLDLSKPKVIIQNIRLHASEDCIPIPSDFFFDKESAIPKVAISYDTVSIDTAFKKIRELLLYFPNMTIRISGHCDKAEKDKNNLSFVRAKYFFDKLIEAGVRKEQLSIEGLADKQPFPLNNNKEHYGVGGFPYTSDQKQLAKRNQRVTFKILDYGFD